ncbi:hypothetical protein FOMPIDRAFT_124092 [Fomitopsis schrenkii]|uniref:CCR4-NOT transcription complex subunit 11 n=1 Tax=Fomitopsis schrenkii TaxID=2126942 RepID=S8DL01_FOMSC|nr:hypothetical protein FOMPIDRAFT_124092 [Fomitopsis schrenkii]
MQTATSTIYVLPLGMNQPQPNPPRASPPCEGIALDVLLPLPYTPSKPVLRILGAYILYSLYAPHPIGTNPSMSENEQFMWVVWKILRGDGSDIEAERTRSDLNDASSFGAEAQIMPEQDQERQRFSDAIMLLLAPRDRVLTLSEQRILLPVLPQLAAVDLPSLISRQPHDRAPLLAALLSSCTANRQDPAVCLEALMHLPPILLSFDLIGKLLRDPTTVPKTTTGGKTTIAAWAGDVELAEETSDDRFAGACNTYLCRLFTSLIKFSIIDPRTQSSGVLRASVMPPQKLDKRVWTCEQLYIVS